MAMSRTRTVSVDELDLKVRAILRKYIGRDLGIEYAQEVTAAIREELPFHPSTIGVEVDPVVGVEDGRLIRAKDEFRLKLIVDGQPFHSIVIEL